MIYPNTGLAAVDLLERLGITVDFPEAQTCCGQMGYNGGYQREARTVAQHFIETFESSEVIVAPSGSCISMVQHFYPNLFADDPVWRPRMETVVSKTWELTEFLVDGLGITDVGAHLKTPIRATLHDACHGLRMLNLNVQPRTLLAHVGNLELVDLAGADQCCGFGGLFAIKMPDVSGAMLNDKLRNIESAEADLVVTCDASCLTQMNGGLHRQRSRKRVVHIAELLAGRIEA
jgi:L-lactate dehydrogenase complex protein LldE